MSHLKIENKATAELKFAPRTLRTSVHRIGCKTIANKLTNNRIIDPIELRYVQSIDTGPPKVEVQLIY